MTDTPFPRRRTTERISDPERIRALAHPVRLALLEHLSDVDEATATECAEAVGESPASCSFHLRTLEKYGYIERAEARGREKPWRVVSAGIDMRPDPEIPGSLRALQAVAMLGLESELLRAREYFEHADAEPDEWVQASTFTRSTFWATAEELAELSRDLQQITDRFAGRHTDPSKRPAGARYSRMMAIANPDPRAAAGADEGGRKNES
jgi:DNA-binding transcriptional ArsR family regulator